MDFVEAAPDPRNKDFTSSAGDRRSALVESLLDAMNQEDPVYGLVVELARLCAGSAAIYSSDAELLSCSGAAPFNLIKAELDRLHSADSEISVGRWEVRGVRITARAHAYTVVLASMDSALQGLHQDFALDVVRRLLGSLDAVDSFATVQHAHRSGLVLKELELGIPAAREPHFWRRMSEFGFTPFTEVRLVVGSTYEGGKLSKEDLKTLADVTGRRRAVLVQEISTHVRDGPSFVLLTPSDGGLIAWLRELEQRFLLGVSEEFIQLSAIPEVQRSVELAHGIAVAAYSTKGARPCSAVGVESLRPHEWLLARVSSARDRRQLRSYTAVLKERPELLHTLVVYMSNDMDVAKAAAELIIHPNTLRYRLAKVESLIDGRLGQPEVITDLYLSLAENIKMHRR